MSLRLSVATEDLDASLKKALAVAADMPISGVRLNTRSEIDVANQSESALRQINLYVKERQLTVAGLYCPTRHALHDSEYLEPRLDVIRQSMSLCRKLGTSELLVRCGRIPDVSQNEPETPPSASLTDPEDPFSFATAASEGASDAELHALLVEILNDLAQHGNHVGCVLNLVLSGYDKTKIDALLASIRTGPVRISFDPATAIMTGRNPTTAYRDLYRHVGYVRARDALKDVDGAGTEVAVSDGVVDWTEFVPTLAEADFRGWICVERTGGDNRAADVRRGVEVLQELLPATGT